MSRSASARAPAAPAPEIPAAAPCPLRMCPRLASSMRSFLPNNCSHPSLRSHSTPDRKSTRLNSSHANISYAVFCLKKKKKYTCHDVWLTLEGSQYQDRRELMDLAFRRSARVLFNSFESGLPLTAC